MKKLILSFVVLISFTLSAYAQIDGQAETYDSIESGALVNGNFLKGDIESENIKVEFVNETIEITSNNDSIVFTGVKPLETSVVNHMEIKRYSCKNPSGDVLICSVAEGVFSIVNTDNNLVDIYSKNY